MTSFDLCPMCGVMREMDVTGFRTTHVDEQGEVKSIMTRAYHCSLCCTFVRCEDVPDTEENWVGVQMEEEQAVEER